MRKVVRFLQKEFGKRLAETVGGSSDYHLLTDGNSLYLETSPQQIVDILKNSRQPMLAICLSDAVRRVRASIARKNKHLGGSSTTSFHRKGNGFIDRIPEWRRQWSENWTS